MSYHTYPSFRDLVEMWMPIKVVDIGAIPIDRPASYAHMLSNGDASVVGFEPNLEALAALERRKGSNETYIPCVVGDGGRHTLHVCQASGMTSLLEPNPEVLRHFHSFPEWATVIAKVPIDTVRLDDIPQSIGMDFLKIDVQGAELMIFQSGTERLRDACVIHTEVEFLPLYKDQPLFSDVDQFLRTQGFVLHRFSEMNSRVIRPVAVNGNPYASLSQHLYADAIFIKDFTRLNRFSAPQLLKTAAILHDCYRSTDLVIYLLAEYDRRTATTLADRFMTNLQQSALDQAA
ncbi:FkbM family methyltransferase [Lichenifustis flavocetrariae]|uniref:FkbM family methyltransferase n=1 Tax=Lichenifustis flavocetrariae TaxID=2949735 RepID=A0AA41Z1Z1_9HYPH|nr:FkbM family methyltransferase [Lichenifustis flavocetrariae]MCW6511355.1 FkbM family methyltransferase [Lichenifustis flavocetrariae]